MPNWCSTGYAFYTKAEDKSELSRFYKNLMEILQTPSEVENGFEPGWLGKVAIKHGLDYESVPCRGWIEHIDEYEPEHGVVTLRTDTAWGPLTELWEAVLTQYDGICFVYIAEEPGLGVFVNTDTEGLYFNEWYLLEIFGDAEVPEGWYADEESPVALDIREYFEYDGELLEYCEKFTGKKFSTVGELRAYFASIFDGSDTIVNIHEFTTA
ncbi:MAG: hypothetical protein FWG87_01575 [Defluviitaleaceae bacterium]|nr:hypothetical protein [Defluviitaleaceae bacterium]